MSWLGALKNSSKSEPTEPKVSPRTAKRNKLQQERLQRAQQRERLRKQIKAAQEAQEAANLAESELLAIDPEIFEGDIDEEVSEDILDKTAEEEVIMVDFDQENVDDSATAMDNLRSVQCPFNKGDIVFWFSQLEDQLTLIGVKKQWTKKIALVRFLPPEIQSEVKSLLKLGQTAAGNDIYFRIKKQLLKLYVPKPEDAYMLAKNLVLSGTPSQLGKQLVELLCPAEIKLNGCHCDRIVWGMFREKIPVLIRNHLADMTFNVDTYEAIFDKADQIWNSNRGSEPQQAAVSSDSAKSSATEVSAIQRRGQNQNQQRGQGQRQRNRNGQGNSGQGNSGQNRGNQGGEKESSTAPKSPVNEDKLCKIHAKWKDNANFCAAPWACRMNNVWKAPQ
jgi:hypothetical protein